MDFAALPPEVNSALIYTGPGPEPLLNAAAAWHHLATELRTTAASLTTITNELTNTWHGPSATQMSTAATHYATWLTTTAHHAEQTATQAQNAAAAYETAFTATVPPPAITANRTQLATLTATNTLGQNTAAIVANETQYTTMWAQDAAAMHHYAAQSTTATTQLTPFTPPPHTTNNTTPTATGAAPQPTSPLDALASFLSQLDASPLEPLAANAEFLPQAILPANSSLINTILALAIGTEARGLAAAADPALGAGLGSGAIDLAPVSAKMGQAGSVGGLAVPRTWSAATPAVRTIAAILSGSTPSAAPAMTMSEGSWLTGTASAGVAGSALGGALARSIGSTGPTVQSAKRDSRKLPSGNGSSQNLQSLADALTARPDSVQHWHTNSENLDSLLEDLRQKPGTHAVHVQDDQPNVAKRQGI